MTEQVSAVPLPAGGLLLLSGLAGVAGLARKKKRAV
ncbi:MAG: VPLPA-CTERM sorting domain-containing protein [Paracoccaceae bacterium]